MRLLTGTLPPDRQGHFHGSSTTNLCLLCSTAPEDRLHFITACVKLCHARQPYLIELEKQLFVSNATSSVSSALSEPHLVLQLLYGLCIPRCQRQTLIVGYRMLGDRNDIQENVLRVACETLQLARAVRVTVTFPLVMIKRDSYDLTMYIITLGCILYIRS